jgi:hypothetical protein
VVGGDKSVASFRRTPEFSPRAERAEENWTPAFAGVTRLGKRDLVIPSPDFFGIARHSGLASPASGS